MNANPFAALKKVDKSHLPVLEEPVRMPKGHKVDPDGPKPFNVGSLVVRPVIGFNTGALEPLYVRFQKTDKGTFMFKAHRPFRNPLAKSMSGHTEHYIVGRPTTKDAIVCFAEGPIPENWTHFRVVGKSKSGKAFFVKPCVGDVSKLYNYPEPVKQGGKLKRLDKTVLMSLLQSYHHANGPAKHDNNVLTAEQGINT